MASFHPKPAFRRGSTDRFWAKVTNNYQCASPKVLWNELWPKYNRVTIPLLDENAFFADAVSIASIARDREELEEMLTKRRDERIEEFQAVLSQMFVTLLDHQHKLEFDAAAKAASKFVRTNSFDSMLQFVGGSMYGWLGDPADQRKPRPWIPVKIERDVPIPEDEVENMNFTQYDSQWDLSSLGSEPSPKPCPSPIPCSFPDEREETCPELEAPSPCDDDAQGTETAAMPSDHPQIPDQQPHSPPPSTYTPPAVSNHGTTHDPRRSPTPTDPRSPGHNHIADPTNLSADDISPTSVVRDSSPPVEEDTDEGQVSRAGATAHTSRRKRQRIDDDGGSGDECDHPRHRRKMDDSDPSLGGAADDVTIASSSAFKSTSAGSPASLEVTGPSSTAVDDIHDASDQNGQAHESEETG